jgi:hypothetical protein
LTALGALPHWLGRASRLNLLVLRLGLRIGSQHILSVPGRKTGRMRNTPVSLVTLDGVRYVVSGEGLSWVKGDRVGVLDRAFTLRLTTEGSESIRRVELA